jgi:hypothetical protein
MDLFISLVKNENYLLYQSIMALLLDSSSVPKQITWTAIATR